MPTPTTADDRTIAEALLGRGYLGPATVVATGAEVRVELPLAGAPLSRVHKGGAASVRMALAFLYEPAVGDVLLVIGGGDAPLYGIGVLHARGRATLAIQGDVDLHAVGGTLRLAGDRGVKLQAPEIDVDAGKLRVVAESLVQKLGSMYQRVTALLSVHSGQSHATVDGPMFTQAESGVIQTKETMTINGKQIQLG